MVNIQCRNIASRTNGAGCIYTEYARTKHTYIHIDNFPFSPQVWGSLRSPQLSKVHRAVEGGERECNVYIHGKMLGVTKYSFQIGFQYSACAMTQE